MKINIPEVLVHLRPEAVTHATHEGPLRKRLSAEHLAMRALAGVFGSRRLYEAAQRAGKVTQRPLVRRGTISRLPGRWPAGARCATCGRFPGRPSATGGGSSDEPRARRDPGPRPPRPR